jgi:lipopolysaccharide export system protein LptC
MHGKAAPSATLFPLILIAALSGMTYWLELASRAPTTSNNGKMRHDPDYIIENFEVRRFDAEGLRQHTLRAPLMRHYPDDDSTVVVSPDLTYHREPPTHVTAREARVDSGAKHVELIDDVRVTRGGVAGKPDSVLTTSHLDAYPDDEIATSKQPVTITQGLTHVTGSGLEANNKTQIYVLDGPVHGIFHRNKGAVVAQTTAAAAAAAVIAPPPVSRPTPSTQPKPKKKPQPSSKPKVKAKQKPKN